MHTGFAKEVRNKSGKVIISQILARPCRLLLLCATALLAAPGFALDPGSTAPAFDVSGIDGQLKLGNYRGKLVYLDFWASWCGPCRRSFPWMNQMQAKYAAHGLQVIAVNLDAKNDEALRFLKVTPGRFQIGFDPVGVTARSYGVTSMPSSVLIDGGGKVILVHRGFNDDDKDILENKIKLALESKP